MEEATFTHTPLQDTATQIRLLRFLDQGPDGSLVFKICDYNLTGSCLEIDEYDGLTKHAPPYAAISYAWGCPDKTHYISINGKRLLVGANCHYALSQAVAARGSSKTQQHYWIDQICIDQENLEEKGELVGNMGEVYRRADTVYACVGPHADKSKLVFDVFNALDQDSYEASSNAGRVELVQQAILRQGIADPNIETLLDYFKLFGERPYWKRLWIVQELWLSRHSIALCGGDSFPLIQFVKFWYIFAWTTLLDTSSEHNQVRRGSEIPRPLYIMNFRTWEQDTGMELFILLTLTEKLLCSDRRDAIYAIGAIVAWPPEKESLKPDYTINNTELFWKVITHMFGDDVNQTHQRHEAQADPTNRERNDADYHQYNRLWGVLHESDMDDATYLELYCRGIVRYEPKKEVNVTAGSSSDWPESFLEHSWSESSLEHSRTGCQCDILFQISEICRWNSLFNIVETYLGR